MAMKAIVFLATGLAVIASSSASANECYRPIWEELSKADLSSRRISLDIDEAIRGSENSSERFVGFMKKLKARVEALGKDDPRSPLHLTGNAAFGDTKAQFLLQLCHRPGEGEKSVCNGWIFNLEPSHEANEATLIAKIEPFLTGSASPLAPCEAKDFTRRNS